MQSTVLANKSPYGLLHITGVDALDLLNRLSSNKLTDLAPCQGTSTVLTTNKGRIIDVLLVINRCPDVLVMTSYQTPSKVMEWIDRYTFSEDILVENLSKQVKTISVIGPGSETLLGIQSLHLDLYEIGKTTLGGVEIEIVRTDRLRLRSYEVLVEYSREQDVLGLLADKGAVPISSSTLETLRVENGVPIYGQELGEDFNPLEAGLDSSISYNKGCYIGQEVVVRLNTYSKVQKSLKWITIENGTPALGTELLRDGKVVGFVTSVATSPQIGRTLAMGYLSTKNCTPGMSVNLSVDGRTIAGVLVDLPISSNL